MQRGVECVINTEVHRGYTEVHRGGYLWGSIPLLGGVPWQGRGGFSLEPTSYSKIASASISTKISGDINRFTSTIAVVGRISLKNSP